MKYFFCLLPCLLSFLILFSCNSNAARANTTAKIGDFAPDFSLKDFAGNTVNLSAYKDKVVLLEFWAAWCPPCKASISALIKMQGRNNAKGSTLIGVSEFSQTYHVNYPVLKENTDIARQYTVRNIPVSFLIDKRGGIANANTGFTDDLNNEISPQIEKII